MTNECIINTCFSRYCKHEKMFLQKSEEFFTLHNFRNSFFIRIHVWFGCASGNAMSEKIQTRWRKFILCFNTLQSFIFVNFMFTAS